MAANFLSSPWVLAVSPAVPVVAQAPSANALASVANAPKRTRDFISESIDSPFGFLVAMCDGKSEGCLCV